MVREFARRLDNWQTTLPQPLRWSSFDQPHETASTKETELHEVEDVNVSESLVSTQELQHQTSGILKAQLRTRFYYARSMLYRPFIYKAVHESEQMTAVDIDFCALAIRSSCAWPLSISTVQKQKRLFPHLFSWTQTSVETLLLLRMALKDDCLRDICHEQVMLEEIEAAQSILEHWLHDVGQLDGVAEWACSFLGAIDKDTEMKGL